MLKESQIEALYIKDNQSAVLQILRVYTHLSLVISGELRAGMGTWSQSTVSVSVKH